LKGLKIVAVLGSEAKRIRALNTPAGVYVINRENVKWLVDYYRQSWKFDCVVLDESTSFKNHQSKRFTALKQVRRFCKKVFLLTGTPSSNGLIDLWSQIYLLDEGQWNTIEIEVGGFVVVYYYFFEQFTVNIGVVLRNVCGFFYLVYVLANFTDLL